MSIYRSTNSSTACRVRRRSYAGHIPLLGDFSLTHRCEMEAIPVYLDSLLGLVSRQRDVESNLINILGTLVQYFQFVSYLFHSPAVSARTPSAQVSACKPTSPRRHAATLHSLTSGKSIPLNPPNLCERQKNWYALLKGAKHFN